MLQQFVQHSGTKRLVSKRSAQDFIQWDFGQKNQLVRPPHASCMLLILARVFALDRGFLSSLLDLMVITALHLHFSHLWLLGFTHWLLFSYLAVSGYQTSALYLFSIISSPLKSLFYCECRLSSDFLSSMEMCFESDDTLSS